MNNLISIDDKKLKNQSMKNENLTFKRGVER